MKTDNKALKQVSDLAGQYLVRKAKVDELEEALKEAKRELDDIESNLLPAAMDQADVLSFETPDGISVKVKEDLNMSFKSGNPAAAFKWLRDHGKGDLIKNTISVEFGKGQDKDAALLAKLLKERKFNFSQKEDVNTSSTKAVIRKVLEAGEEDVPLEHFGATQYRKAIVKVKA